MSRDFEHGSAQYIDVGKTTMTVGLDGKPAVSISCIINLESFDSSSQALFHIVTSSGGAAVAFGVRNIGNSDVFMAGRSLAGDSFQSANSDGTINIATEYVLGGYLDVANDKIRIYIDGSPQTEANVSFGNAVFNIGTPSVNNTIGTNSVGNSQYWDGTIAELGIWDVKLTDDEFLILADRYSPLFVRPQNLVGYWRLIRGINDEILGIVGSNNGSIVVPHPSIIYPANVRVGVPAAAGGIAVFASISDGLGVSDTIATKTGHARSIPDGLGISDTLARIGTYIRSLASNLATTDTINTARNLKRSMSENVGVSDTLTTKKFVLVTLSDNLGITDVLTRIITFVRSIPDALAISDTLATIRTILRSIADGVGITDVLTSEKFILVAIADGIGLTDTIATIGTFLRGIADGVGLTDVISRIGTFIRSESDNVGVTDTVTASKGVSRTITDGVGITDVIAAILGKLSSIADTLGITDVLTFIRTTVVGGRVFIAGIARSLRISGTKKSLTISGEDKSLKISGSGD